MENLTYMGNLMSGEAHVFGNHTSGEPHVRRTSRIENLMYWEPHFRRTSLAHPTKPCSSKFSPWQPIYCICSRGSCICSRGSLYIYCICSHRSLYTLYMPTTAYILYIYQWQPVYCIYSCGSIYTVYIIVAAYILYIYTLREISGTY